MTCRRATTLLACLTSALALACALLLGLGQPAQASPADPGTTAPRADGVAGEALDRARRALDGGEVVPGRRPDATLALRDLFLARPTLDADAARTAGRLLARPTDRAADPYGDGYRVKARKTCNARVCVHWVPTTRDAPPDRAWVDTTLAVVDDVWRREVDELGYRRPAPDGRRGGDKRFDVYLKELGSTGLYGYCAPEAKVPGRLRQASGFCVLDNDFARRQYDRAPRQTLRVTAAHEFFHAIQFAYDFREDPWLLESTATWMEEQVADSVNDNRTYLPYGQLARPREPLDTFSVTGYAHYGNWLWWQFLSDRYGPATVRQVLARAGTGAGRPNDYSVAAVEHVLDRRGGFARIYADFAIANLRAGTAYREGAAYPPSRAREARLGPGRTRYGVRLDHLTSAALTLRPAAALAGPLWRLRLSLDGPRPKTSPVAVAVVEHRDGRVTRRRIAVDAEGRGRAQVRFSARSVSQVTVVLANASTRYRCGEGTTSACRGVARDDDRRFALDVDVVRSSAR